MKMLKTITFAAAVLVSASAYGANQIDVTLELAYKADGTPHLLVTQVTGDAEACPDSWSLTECFAVPRNQKDNKIDFWLRGACQDFPYGLHEVRISTGSGSLPAYAQQDFDADASGKVKAEQKKEDRIKVKDDNKGMPDGSGYEVNYEVVATHCEDGSQISFDPRIKNGGSD